MQAIDDALLRIMFSAGQDLPLLRTVARGITELGGWRWLVPFTLIVAGWLGWRGKWRDALALLLVTGGGRWMVELMKSLMARPRPDLIDHQVLVHSLSFPSGHAANSMIVYLAAALIVKADRAKLVALSMAAAIGLTRPLLGVHWPSDVLAGWAFGLAWTLGTLWMLDGWMKGRPDIRSPRDR